MKAFLIKYRREEKLAFDRSCFSIAESMELAVDGFRKAMIEKGIDAIAIKECSDWGEVVHVQKS